MRLVVLRTGLTPDLLRAWEKRYGVVTPVRSHGGQRLYSDADVERLSLLARAVKGGRAIGQIAKLPLRELQRIVEKDAIALSVIAAPVSAIASESRESIHAAALAAVERFDAAELEFTLRGAAMRLGMDEMLDGVIGPLLLTIGSRWHAGLLSPAHEHLATDVVRRTLTWMMEKGAPLPTAPTFVVGTLAGQTHELGAMLAAAAASRATAGVSSISARTCRRPRSPSRRTTPAQPRSRSASFIRRTIRRSPARYASCAQHFPKGSAIIAGGTAAPSYVHALAAVGALRFGSIRAFRSWLRKTLV